jgi:hypothetical protein
LTVGAPGRIARPSSSTGEDLPGSADNGPKVASPIVAPVRQDRVEPSARRRLVREAVRRLLSLGELFGDDDPTVTVERPLGALEEVRLQSARIGVASTVAVLLVLLLYALLPGHYPLSRAPFFILIAVAIAGTIPIALLPWNTLTQRGLVLPVLYTWSLFDIALVSYGVDLTGGSHSDLYLVYLLQCVFMANVSYPRRGRITLTVMTVGAYVVALAGAGWGIGPPPWSCGWA